ncbi:hypothetical protein HELRODRAFT_110990 [Helobdella robusta]|uniref:Uncharacterized protein n=1 Tax=Helobdella robusta TaxID=6412 RepID=T1EF69_HELRO|nr:hypothetical protein HELRODRAFT_110990 [Helobdella robusta]ESO06974.1 hypothetical protein HELRODRAFT_110990 [Helobdella robusta]
MDGLKCFSCFSSEDAKKSRERTKSIDRQLSLERQRQRATVKILLLGAGESGKSTFIKQMRIINGKKFTEDELKMYKYIVYSNIVMGMKVLIDATLKLNLGFEKENSMKNANLVFSFDPNINLEEPVFQQYVQAIGELWEDAGVQAAYSRRREFLLGDSTKYFMDNLARISQMNYKPTNSDILYSRKATKGVNEHRIDINNVHFNFIDVGGQRSQRGKWFNCFEEVTSILFLVSSSEFDQNIYEDRKTNRLTESCNIFRFIATHRLMLQISIILFLNKTDLLHEKVRTSDISTIFPTFVGDPRSVQDVQKFLLENFTVLVKDRPKPLYHHFTTAVDTENIKHVFKDVRKTILSNNLDNLLLQ